MPDALFSSGTVRRHVRVLKTQAPPAKRPEWRRKPFWCQYCGARFADRNELLAHLDAEKAPGPNCAGTLTSGAVPFCGTHLIRMGGTLPYPRNRWRKSVRHWIGSRVKIEPTLVAVLSGINMPGIDGLQLLAASKQQFLDLPVMMVRPERFTEISQSRTRRHSLVARAIECSTLHRHNPLTARPRWLCPHGPNWAFHVRPP